MTVRGTANAAALSSTDKVPLADVQLFTLDVHIETGAAVNGNTDDFRVTFYVDLSLIGQVLSKNNNLNGAPPVRFDFGGVAFLDGNARFFLSNVLISDQDTRGRRFRILRPTGAGALATAEGGYSELGDGDSATFAYARAVGDAVTSTLTPGATPPGPEHNRAVGGATRSKHLLGAAFDIEMSNHDPVAFEAAAREVGFLGFGFYPRSGFMHVDLGPERQWGTRFSVRETAFATEPPHAREVLAESRTMKGGGAAGVATLGAAGVEVVKNVLTETQSAILPLVPYLDTLRWVFIAVALIGVTVTIYARWDDWRKGRR